MAKFGRFEFGKSEPSETYEGDRMELEKPHLKILRGERRSNYLGLGLDEDSGDIAAIIHLDKGQSVREIEPNLPKEDEVFPSIRKKSERS